MKIRQLVDGETIEVGDLFRCVSGITGTRHYPIERVTAKYAIIRWNDIGKGKVLRVVNSWCLRPVGKNMYDMTTYSVWRKVEEKSDDPSKQHPSK